MVADDISAYVCCLTTPKWGKLRTNEGKRPHSPIGAGHIADKYLWRMQGNLAIDLPQQISRMNLFEARVGG